jgi:hypothetical protein
VYFLYNPCNTLNIFEKIHLMPVASATVLTEKLLDSSGPAEYIEQLFLHTQQDEHADGPCHHLKDVIFHD